MCGIAGLIQLDGVPASRAAIEAMTTALAHRGPNDSGQFVDGQIALGMRRLSIIDLSPLGHQPMGNEDDQIQIVFNGEIYNFKDLRSHLDVAGHRFRSQSDTEVIVHGYEEFGAVELARRLEGMFAIAILDRPRRQLHLMRDPFGIKPIYVRRTSGRVSFASEVRALALDGSGPLKVDPAFIPSFLRLGWIPHPRTAFEGVVRLDPGTVLTIDLRSGEETTRRFYELRPAVLAQTSGDALLERLGELLTLSVRRQLISDVPLGVFLSGGLDSSTLAGVATPLVNGRLQTFSVGFAQSDRGDESSFAAQVARKLGSDATQIQVSPDDFGALEAIVGALEEPLADSAVIPLWQLCKGTAAKVRVALSGEGGDETLGGYPRYFWGLVSATMGHAPESLRESVSRWGHVLPERSKGPFNVLRRATKFADSASLPEGQRYLAWFDVFTPEERVALHLGREDRALERVEGLFAEARRLGLDPVQRLQYVDLQNMLLDNLLAKSDRLSMAHSLEVRVPLLDRPLVEFGLALPTSAKVGPRSDKRLLREFVARVVDPAIANRPKRGFEIPVDAWFRTGGARRHAAELSGGALVRSLGFSAVAIDRLVERHTAGEDLGRKLFALLSLEFWARRYAS